MRAQIDTGTPPLSAPSILSSDFSALGEAVRLIDRAGGDWIHLDVMDGCFVPNITFGAKAVADLRALSPRPFDVHLMIRSPEAHVESFAEAGADFLTVHYEATVHLHRLLDRMRELGVRPGVSIVPSTPASVLTEVAGMCDIILVMTVNPGYGGQSLIPACLEKVTYLKELRESRGYSYLLQVDGGIGPETAPKALRAGADVLVAGSAVFSAADPASVIRDLTRNG